MLLATEHYVIAEPINIATPKVSTIYDVWKTLFDIEGLPYVVQYLGDKPKVVSRRVVNVARCKDTLGYECPTSLEDGLRQTLDWYKSQQ